MSLPKSTGFYRAEARYADLLKQVGLPDAMSVFENPKIEVWRSITERENCVLDHAGGRFHIKRNQRGYTGAESEVDGIQLLQQANIKTVPLVAWGRLNDRRGFLITDDLAGFNDAEKLVRDGLTFERLLNPTATLAGKLHAAGLHHRDLYLCHFYAQLDQQSVQLSLMDAGRVRRLPHWFKRRWIVKDVSQFLFSLRQLGVSQKLSHEWLMSYESALGVTLDGAFHRAVERKIRWIDRHDAKLQKEQPTRNVAIDR